MSNYPKRIVCLTEESVEFLFAIGQGQRVVGVSAYVKRPAEALALPKVTAFINGHIDKICDLKPDLVLGFSDIQKDLARDLIGRGLNVFIANHRSIDEILNYLIMLGAMVGEQQKTEAYIKQLKTKLKEAQQFAKSLSKKPEIYIEEWNDPRITAIKWFSEIVILCGGVNVFVSKSNMSMGSDRIVTDEELETINPDIILACWCGKKVEKNVYYDHKSFKSCKAVHNNQVYELEPEIFLQPGPAPIISGIDILISIFKSWEIKSK